MLYLIGHTKGGVGKTTIATNIATVLAKEGARVCLVDADEQLHANRFCTRRLEYAPNAPRIDCHVMDGGLHKRLLALRRRYDHVIVDAGGADSEELRSAARTVDVMLAPFSPSQNELDAFGMLKEKVVSPAYDYNPGLCVVALPNKIETHAKRQNRLPAARDFVEGKGFTVLGCRLSLRASPYQRTAELGQGIGELGDAQAYAELLAVLGETHELARRVVIA